MSRLVVDSRCRPPASYGCCVLIRIGCRDWGINFFRFPPLLQLPSRRIDSSSWLAEKSVGWQLVTGKSSVVGLFVSLKENERRKERNELALLLFMEVRKHTFTCSSGVVFCHFFSTIIFSWWRYKRQPFKNYKHKKFQTNSTQHPNGSTSDPINGPHLNGINLKYHLRI